MLTRKNPKPNKGFLFCLNGGEALQPNEISEKIAERKGKLTPRALVSHLLDAIDRGEVETVTYVVREPNGQIKNGYSEGQQTEVLGLLECAKYSVIDDMYE
jgi:hypothetical protein